VAPITYILRTVDATVAVFGGTVRHSIEEQDYIWMLESANNVDIDYVSNTHDHEGEYGNRDVDDELYAF